MKRIGITIGVSLAALWVLAACLYAFFFVTAPGRGILLSQIERQLGAALNSDAEIETLGGALPNLIVLDNTTLRGDEEAWLTVEQLRMRWRPLSLLSGGVDFEMVAIDGAQLLKQPPKKDDTENKSDLLSISLPKNLPRLKIDRLELSNITVMTSGAEERINGHGRLKMGGRTVNARLNVTTAQNLDTVDITLDLSPENGRLFLDGLIAATPGGIIAAMAELDDPLLIEAKSDSPIEGANIRLNGTLGGYGELTATISANLENLKSADARLLFTPGAALNAAPEFSTPLVAETRIEERRNGGAVIVRSINSAAGEIAGEVIWRNRGRFVDHLTADLKATLNESYRSSVRRTFSPDWLSNDISFAAALSRNDKEYEVTAALESGQSHIKLNQGRTDLSKLLNGQFAISLPPSDSAPLPFSLGVEASGSLSLATGDMIAINSFIAHAGDTSSLTAQGRYDFADETVALAGDIEAGPELMNALSSTISTDAAFTGMFELSGPLDRLTLKSEIETPESLINDTRLPPLKITTALAALPALPTGEIIAVAQSGAYGRFEAQLRSSVDGTISVPALTYRGECFELNGNSVFSPDDDSLSVDLNYTGDDAASPWPGVTLSGDLAAQGVLSRDGERNQFSLASEMLRTHEIAISGLAMSANGPPDATAIVLSSSQFTSPATGLIENLTASATASLKGALGVTLNSFNAIIAGSDASLSQPAAIQFAEGVDLSNLRLAYGEEGSIAIDANLSDARWRAQVKLDAVNIPQVDGVLSLNLDLDTERQMPAQGGFRLRSLLANGVEAGISGDVLWDGESLNITNTKDADLLDMQIALPALLTRQPALSVETTGPLEGYIRYQGDAQTIAAYLRPNLQSLEGDIALDFSITGDRSAPELSGSATLSDGEYTELRSGFALTGLHVTADASYNAQGSTVDFTGGARGARQEGEDTISLSGALNLTDTSSLDLTIDLDNAVLAAEPVTNLHANGRITITGPLEAIKADGEISIEDLDAEIIAPESTGLVDIDVVSSNAVTDLSAEHRPAEASIDYQISMNADDRVFVRGRGLESEWSADITASSDNGEPLLLGSLTLRRGWIDFSGRRFDLTSGEIAFDRLSANNPALDITAEYETGDGVTAVIVVSGRADSPSIELQSTPSLPSEDIIALVLFGKAAAELSAIESLQTAQALASLGGVGPFGGEGITGRLRQSLGLDLLNIDIDPENGGGELTIGKYVSDGIFVSATQDGNGDNGSVRVEYAVTDDISVETELDQDGTQTVSASWKRDF